jgi:hypothetical protein
VYAPKGRHNQSIQPYFSALLVLSFVASIVLVAFVTLCCFEEKSIQTNLTRQGFIPFHVSHQVSVRTYFGDSAGEQRSHVDRCSKFCYIIGDLHQFIDAMMNPKQSGARTKVGPHNMNGLAMEDLPEAERRALEKELKEEMAEAKRRKLACFQKTRKG